MVLTWLKTFGKTHLFYILIIVLGAISFRTWLAEHDARRSAEQAAAVSAQQVKQLQQQIVAIQAQADQQVKTIQTVAASAKTPQQQLALIPQLSSVDLNARAIAPLTPVGPPQVAVDLAPLVQELAVCKETAVQLQACTQTSTLKDQQLVAKDTEIKALKKKPSLWKRVKKDVEFAGVILGIGVALGAHL